jgi:hypothetical protein
LPFIYFKIKFVIVNQIFELISPLLAQSMAELSNETLETAQNIGSGSHDIVQ